jgi:hypothetical protein
MCRISHIIAPVIVQESSDLYLTQPITFRTMQMAKEKAIEDGIIVNQYAAFFPEDQSIVPEGFIHTSCLDRSVTDVMELNSFTPHRKLPLIGDILERLYHAADPGYLIYTNVDIGLQPDFYLQVHQLIREGFDAFIINRRTIPKYYQSIEQIPEMFKERGKKHPGQDCFIFKREVFPRYILNMTCIGAQAVGKAMVMNMIAHATKFKMFTDLHLTFHVGEDRVWCKNELNDYRQHNIAEVLKIYDDYHEKGLEFSHPVIQKFLTRFRPQK